MKDSFRVEFMSSISERLTSEQMQFIEAQLLLTMKNYEVTRQCTDLALLDDIPEPVKIYIASKKIEGASEKTLTLYAMRLKHFFLTVRKPLATITTNDVRLFLYTYQEQHKVTNRTLDAIRTVISTFFKWAACEQYIPYDVTAQIHSIKYTVKEREPLTSLEIEELRGACITPRDKALIDVLYSTGCRVSELVNIKKSDISSDGKTVILFGKGSKYREAYLNDRARLSIAYYLQTRDDEDEHLFVSSRKPHRGLKKNAIEDIVRKIGQDAGIPRKVFPHLIRHSTATISLERGMDIVDVQKVLGHENISTTMIYAKRSRASVRASHSRCII